MSGIKRKSIKNMLFKNTLVFVSVIAAVLIVEISLRGTPYDNRLGYSPFEQSLDYMYDEYSGYDIRPNSPKDSTTLKQISSVALIYLTMVKRTLYCSLVIVSPKPDMFHLKIHGEQSLKNYCK